VQFANHCLCLLLQMHVHLAEVFPSMMDAVEKVHKAGNTSAYIVCKDKQTSDCSISDKATRDTTSIKVGASWSI
jgi:hypothetical protein